MSVRTSDTHRRRAGQASPAEDMKRRIKQILLANPGYGENEARRAAGEESEAARLLAVASAKQYADASLNLRAKQLRAGNLSLDDAAALNLARVQSDHGAARRNRV